MGGRGDERDCKGLRVNRSRKPLFHQEGEERLDAAIIALCYKVDLSFHLMMGKVIYSLLLFLACHR